MRIPKTDEPKFKYWLGMLAADGCLQKRKCGSHVLRLGLKPSDKNHLQKFLDYLELPNKIYDNSLAGVSEIHINQKSIFEPFIKFGLHPCKTNTMKAHREVAYDSDFWRGMFDGDGNLGLYSTGKNQPKSPRALLCGNTHICAAFLEFLSLSDERFLKNNVMKHGPIWAVGTKGVKALIMIKLLQYHKTNLALDRKQQVAFKLLSHQPTALRLDAMGEVSNIEGFIEESTNENF